MGDRVGAVVLTDVGVNVKVEMGPAVGPTFEIVGLQEGCVVGRAAGCLDGRDEGWDDGCDDGRTTG